MRPSLRPFLVSLLVMGWIALSAGAAIAQVATGVLLPEGEAAADWEEAFALAGVTLATAGEPQVELIDRGEQWLLRVHAPDGLREVPVPAPADATARAQIAILSMSLLMPGPADPAPEPAPPSADPPPPAVEREPVSAPVRSSSGDSRGDGATEEESERVPVYLPALKQGGSGDGADSQDDEPEDERDETATRPTPPRERASAPPKPPRQARTRTTRAAPLVLHPFFVGASTVQFHRDHLPALHLLGGGGLWLTPEVRLGLAFVGGFPTGMTLFEDDGATRRVTSLGGRAAFTWTPASPVSPLVRMSFGADVRSFSQDGVKVADVTVPVIEIGGGGSFSPTPGLRIEPLAELRLDLRQIPVDVGGAQEHDLLPFSLLAGLSISLGPPPRTNDAVATANKMQKN